MFETSVKSVHFTYYFAGNVWLIIIFIKFKICEKNTLIIPDILNFKLKTMRNANLFHHQYPQKKKLYRQKNWNETRQKWLTEMFTKLWTSYKNQQIPLKIWKRDTMTANTIYYVCECLSEWMASDSPTKREKKNTSFNKTRYPPLNVHSKWMFQNTDEIIAFH